MAGFQQRRLSFEIDFTQDTSNRVMTFNEFFYLKANIQRTIRYTMNTATATMSGMNEKDRAALLSAFTEWNFHQFQQGGSRTAYAQLKINAGYTNGPNGNQVSTVFQGDIASIRLIEGLPNITFEIKAYTGLTNKVSFVQSGVAVPAQGTFQQMAQFVATQLGLQLHMDSALASNNYQNVFTQLTYEGLIYALARINPGNTAVWVDAGILWIVDIGRGIFGTTKTVKDFIGVPNWTEFGMEGTVMFDPSLVPMQAVAVQSVLNTGLGTAKDPGGFIISEVNLNLASRETPFYTTIRAYPNATPPAKPAQSGKATGAQA